MVYQLKLSAHMAIFFPQKLVFLKMADKSFCISKVPGLGFYKANYL